MPAETHTDEPFLRADDLYLFNEGTQLRLYEKLGAHLVHEGGRGASGAHFAVWAPNAGHVSVIGDFNGWNKEAHPLSPQGSSGIWAGFIPKVRESARYKYHIVSSDGQFQNDKLDPIGFCHEHELNGASLVWDLAYEWQDQEWMATRQQRQSLDKPISIYEVHLGSWRRVPEEKDRPLTYREAAPLLAEHVARLGFTHVQFLPLMEHRVEGSWGYQTTGYFAPTSRHGTPQDLMFLIDCLHQRNIGVIFDWVPSHFARDEQGLARFDGTDLYSHEDPRQGFHQHLNSYLFNYDRPEVRSFLLSNALFWFDRYHIDGLHASCVTLMLYRDYSRAPGEWVPNRFGGKENLGGIAFLRDLNVAIYHAHPDAQTFAKESSGWAMISRPGYSGGLGFGFTSDMKFTRDTLRYFAQDPGHRKYSFHELTLRPNYAFAENFVLPFPHDEVAAGKGSLLARMPGDGAERFSNLRLLLGYMFLQPGKKLLFMGNEFAQWREWNHEISLDWHIATQPFHAGVQKWVHDLNELYCDEPALHEGDVMSDGFEWIDHHDAEQSTLSWVRKSGDGGELLLVVCNLTALPRTNYRIGAPMGGNWDEILNSNAVDYGGSGQGNLGGMEAAPFSWHGRPYTLTLTLPPLGLAVFKPRRRARDLTPERAGNRKQ
jgi:1,4-alpha-glucan branching enzyme